MFDFVAIGEWLARDYNWAWVIWLLLGAALLVGVIYLRVREVS